MCPSKSNPRASFVTGSQCGLNDLGLEVRRGLVISQMLDGGSGIGDGGFMSDD
jgi:hypothetical protein